MTFNPPNVWDTKNKILDLYIEEINRRLSYVSVKDRSTGKGYFTQGEEAEKDIDYIDEYSEDAFLDMLASSGYFDR